MTLLPSAHVLSASIQYLLTDVDCHAARTAPSATHLSLSLSLPLSPSPPPSLPPSRLTLGALIVVTVQVPSSSLDAAQQEVDQYTSAVQKEYGSLEKGLHIALGAAPAVPHVLTVQAAQQLLTLLLLLPHGVVKHSHTVAGAHLCDGMS